MSIWRIYVGGLFTGFAIGGFVAWWAAWTIVPEACRAKLPYLLLSPLPIFLIAGEHLRIRGQRQADDVAERENRRLVLRSVPLGLILLVIGGAVGALVGWLWGTDGGMLAGAGIGAPIGYVLGSFLHGLREGIQS